MATDWLATLNEQKLLAEAMKREVPQTLANQHITEAQVVKLYRALEQQAQFIEQLSRKFEEKEFDFDVVDASRALEDLFSALAADAAEKLKQLRQGDSIQP